jgi:hypothetical protein
VFDVSTHGVTRDPVDLCLAHVVKSNFLLRMGTCSRNVLDFVAIKYHINWQCCGRAPTDHLISIPTKEVADIQLIHVFLCQSGKMSQMAYLNGYIQKYLFLTFILFSFT